MYCNKSLFSSIVFTETLYFPEKGYIPNCVLHGDCIVVATFIPKGHFLSVYYGRGYEAQRRLQKYTAEDLVTGATFQDWDTLRERNRFPEKQARNRKIKKWLKVANQTTPKHSIRIDFRKLPKKKQTSITEARIQKLNNEHRYLEIKYSTTKDKNKTSKHGLFTKINISPGVYIGEHKGKIIETETEYRKLYPKDNPKHTLRVEKPSDKGYYIDAEDVRLASETRWIKHSNHPNAEIKQEDGQYGPKIIIITTKALKRGDEILLKYDACEHGGKQPAEADKEQKDSSPKPNTSMENILAAMHERSKGKIPPHDRHRDLIWKDQQGMFSIYTTKIPAGWRYYTNLLQWIRTTERWVAYRICDSEIIIADPEEMGRVSHWEPNLPRGVGTKERTITRITGEGNRS